jgi:WD40 repeat protein
MHGKYIYLASEDGKIKIVKIKKSKIEYVRSLVKAEERCLSLALVTKDISEKSLVKTLYAGYDNSSIKQWNLSTGNSD